MGRARARRRPPIRSRLAEELGKHFPGHEFTVLNRGVNGEEITDMLARLDTAVIAERPDLVLWQVDQLGATRYSLGAASRGIA